MTLDYQHVDHIQQSLAIGDIVACTHHRSLRIGTVIKQSPKMIRIKLVKEPKRYGDECNKYPYECVKIQTDAITMWLLKQ